MEAYNISHPYDNSSTSSDSDESNTTNNPEPNRHSDMDSEEDLIQPIQETDNNENYDLPGNPLRAQTMTYTESEVEYFEADEDAIGSDDEVNRYKSEIMLRQLKKKLTSEREWEDDTNAAFVALSQLMWCLYSAYFTFISNGIYLHLPVLTIFPHISLFFAFTSSANYLYAFNWSK